MISAISRSEAENGQAAPGQILSISPHHNPGHFLAPPSEWLEGVRNGDFSWEFFRLRYKAMLRKRFEEEPGRVFALLDASRGPRTLFLSCDCSEEPCHREVAGEFLENLRGQQAYMDHTIKRAGGVAVLTAI